MGILSLNGASGKPTIAVDAMGGDFAPGEVVKGAAEAYHRGVDVALVGNANVLEAPLSDLAPELPVVQAADSIPMDESVGQAMRRTGSSLHVAAQLVAHNDADGVVSCGNSAAIMGVTLRTWGMQSGIDRPAFGGMIPTHTEGVFVLDIGANSSVKARNLVQFAVMGEVWVEVSRGIEAPRVALLSNGSEDSKGTKEVKEANEVLRSLDMNFIGNVEGNQIFDNVTDVVVCDGFAGNVLLKGAEGVAGEIFQLLKDEVSKDLVSRVAAAALMPALSRIKRRIDYEEYGGAPVLGVNGVMINCHGRSSSKAVTNAILLAEHMVREKLIARISQALNEEVGVGRRRRLVRALHLRHE